ncbi:MAG: DUF1521 domain-containing protein [Pseudomonadota bacterium]
MTKIKNSDFNFDIEINIGGGGGGGGALDGLDFGDLLGGFGDPIGPIIQDIIAGATGNFERGDRQAIEAWADDRANGISDVLNAWRDETLERRNGSDEGGLDGIADALGDLANDADDQGVAADINEIESDLRRAIADGADPEALEAIADRIGDLVNDIDDPDLAAALNEIESDLRAEIDDMTGGDLDEQLDGVADALGDLANDVDDQALAAKINDIETKLRRAIADGADEETLDAIADEIGDLVNDIDDQDLAGSLNDIETDLREIIAGMSDDIGTTETDGQPLTVEGNGTVDTGRYTIEATHNTVKIKDNETGKWIKAWGDPHLHTSDGDKAQFHEDNLTIDLPDGTKVTLQPTEKNGNGLSFVDKVAITKGDEAVVISGVHDNKISNTGVLDGDGAADGVDLSFEDGTVLEVGDELDDLFFTDENGDRLEELVGQDPTQRFNEWMLDGRGGASDLGAEN